MAERTLQENTSSSQERIVGAEWWAHTRPLGANLGHQLHFDTDESLLGREKKVTHPILSSVLYLTGACEDAKAGATIVFDQTPESKDVASTAWVSHPKNNSYMNFAGDLLHGVLPCTGVENVNKNVGDSSQPIHRLTLMVGFWTRNVTIGMGKRQLYSPCGPLPPSTSEHSWVIESQRGYNNTKQTSKNGGNRDEISFDALPSASPAWEHFDSKVKSPRSDELAIPKGLDHRFFVNNAPHCFTESLFDKEDCF